MAARHEQQQIGELQAGVGETGGEGVAFQMIDRDQRLARSMGQRTVAEFVEDAETLKLLREYGVDFVQGYYLDRPRANHPALGK